MNVHAFTLDNRLLNGNDSGIGIVIRDRKVRNLTRRANKLWALLVGLKGAFLENEECVELESNNWEAIKGWDEYKWFHNPNHANVIQQLNQRMEDTNLTLVVTPIDSSQNALARYLAQVRSWQRLRLVVIRRLFGEVKELWMLDMGLGLVRVSLKLFLRMSTRTGCGREKRWRRMLVLR